MGKYISIGNRRIGVGRPVFIIAEAGVNHNGSLKLAKKMVRFAGSVGACAIKFQTFKTEDVVTRNSPKPNYQKKSTSFKSHFDMLKNLELSNREFKDLRDYCNSKKITFLSTPFDSKSANFLHQLNIQAFKISSSELTNMPLLLQIAKYARPIILSTGMATLEEVREAVQTIYSTGNRRIILLHCTSNYPTKFEDVNLRAINTLSEKFNVLAGYSDHSLGIEVSIAAVAMGGCVIEKHFTLDRNLPGPDHKASLEPDEFKKMVQSIRNIEKAIGEGVKIPRKSEIEVRKIARKSIVTACDIPKGVLMKLDMLTVKRPGTGIEPKFLDRLVGKRVKSSLKRDRVLDWKNIV